ncbi:PqqD family protein [Bradyrhizobium sp. LMTR 3]|uniref:PqqD family protein n=1 Tax=Bradyrhizobium sp. LMTR 3 TaxID=189873 RepID=UPI001FD8CBEE|nr:PqqD family protein [Bradyrhizobium sp. LMTR 3]
MLNLNAWLIFELCDGSSPDHVAQRYRKSVADQMSEREADRHLTIGIKNLHDQGLIELKVTD